MKNILAENMKRFGTKNLTESQLETILEMELNEAPGDLMSIVTANGKQLQDTLNQYAQKLTQPGKEAPLVFKVTLKPAPDGGLLLKLDNGFSTGIGTILELTPNVEPSQAIQYTKSMGAEAQVIMQNSENNWMRLVNQDKRRVTNTVVSYVKQTANAIASQLQAAQTSQTQG